MPGLHACAGLASSREGKEEKWAWLGSHGTRGQGGEAPWGGTKQSCSQVSVQETGVRVCVHVHTRLCVCVFQGAVLLHGSASLVIFFLP